MYDIGHEQTTTNMHMANRLNCNAFGREERGEAYTKVTFYIPI